MFKSFKNRIKRAYYRTRGKYAYHKNKIQRGYWRGMIEYYKEKRMWKKLRHAKRQYRRIGGRRR
jgi:hypothetical protein